MAQVREKFTIEIDCGLLADLRKLADEEGRQVHSLVEEAVAALIVERRKGTARPHVMRAYRKSHGRLSSLYDKLAK